MAEAASQFEQDCGVVHHSLGRGNGGTHALNAALAVGDRAFALAPTGGAWQHDVGDLSGFRVEKILHHQKFQIAHEFTRAMAVRFGGDRIFPKDIKRCELAVLHRFEHSGNVQAGLGIHFHAPGFFEFGAKLRILDVLETGEAVRDRAHVAAALNIILAAQGIDAAAVAADVAGEKSKVDERENIVDRVVVFGDAECPAHLRAGRFRVGVRGFADQGGGHAGFAFGALERVFLHGGSIGFESAGGMLDKFLVGQAGMNDFSRHRVGERNI